MDEPLVRRAPQSDEIDLIELFRALWSQKWLIVLVTVLVTACAAAYAFLAKPVYQARVAVFPPSLSDIAPFNFVRNAEIGLEPLTTEGVYAVFTRNLQSDEARRSFFYEVYLPSLPEDERNDSQDDLYERFSEDLSIKTPGKDQPDRYELFVERKDPAQAADWARLYLERVARESLQQMRENARSEILVRGRTVQQQIDTLREAARNRRDDRIVRLKEALAVADALKLEDPPVVTGQEAGQLSSIMDGSLMYMRGAKALRAEIQSLETRESDDPFIGELRNLQEKYNLYAGLKIDAERGAVFRQDGSIVTPDEPIKPKKLLILALGVVLGGMLGLFIALVRAMLKKRSAD